MEFLIDASNVCLTQVAKVMHIHNAMRLWQAR
jgi:hypothetical protein